MAGPLKRPMVEGGLKSSSMKAALSQFPITVHCSQEKGDRILCTTQRGRSICVATSVLLPWL